jgi:hypothetical protein
MADRFGVPQLVDYLTQMGLHITDVDHEQEIIELAFHGDGGQWRLIINIQQSDDIRKLMLIVPHLGTITTKKRMECLEALLAANYRIAMGKFGVDPEDGEIRLEEAVPIANAGITQEQFQLVFSAMMQTVAMYHSLIPRIIYGNLTTQQALEACEQEFFQEFEGTQERADTPEEIKAMNMPTETDTPPELDAYDVLAEVRRMLEEPKE